MLLDRSSRLATALTATLVAGTLFAGVTVYADFVRFYQAEGTLLKVRDCAFPNPVTTACFYGFWGFLVAAVWSRRLLHLPVQLRLRSQGWLAAFTAAGTVFALSNMVPLLVSYYRPRPPGPIVGCSGQLVTSPFLTPCFGGTSLFMLGAVLAYLTYRSYRRA